MVENARPKEGKMTKRQNIVQSIDRALTLLERIASHAGGLRLSDLAREVGLPVSTVHRLLTSLEDRRFVQMDRVSGNWAIGERANFVGSAYTQLENLAIPARPVLQRLRDLTRETANFGHVIDWETVTLAQVESREIMRAISPPGGRVPVLNSGMGKAIVAYWPDEAVETLILKTGLHPMTSKSLRTREAVFDDLRQTRDRGYAVDDQEFVTGMRCIAAPVWTTSEEPSSAVSISGLSARVTASKLSTIANQVCEASRELSHVLAGHTY